MVRICKSELKIHDHNQSLERNIKDFEYILRSLHTLLIEADKSLYVHEQRTTRP